MATTSQPELSSTICVIGSGPAGLVTAHTLLRDGFTNVDVITKDKSAGGVWAAGRVSSGMPINKWVRRAIRLEQSDSLSSVHGEFRFSHMTMPQPQNAEETGGRLSGDDMRKYMENFAQRFLKGRIRYNMEVLRVNRHASGKKSDGWTLEVLDKETESTFQLDYDRVVLCTGVGRIFLSRACVLTMSSRHRPAANPPCRLHLPQ